MPRNQPILKGYRAALEGAEHQRRYDKKLAFAEGKDPYEMAQSDWIDDVDAWPGITHIHLGMYLIVKPSPYTGEALLNYKSMDCYEKFLARWVHGIQVHKLPSNDNRIVTA